MEVAVPDRTVEAFSSFSISFRLEKFQLHFGSASADMLSHDRTFCGLRTDVSATIKSKWFAKIESDKVTVLRYPSRSCSHQNQSFQSQSSRLDLFIYSIFGNVSVCALLPVPKAIVDREPPHQSPTKIKGSAPGNISSNHNELSLRNTNDPNPTSNQYPMSQALDYVPFDSNVFDSGPGDQFCSQNTLDLHSQRMDQHPLSSNPMTSVHRQQSGSHSLALSVDSDDSMIYILCSFRIRKAVRWNIDIDWNVIMSIRYLRITENQKIYNNQLKYL